MLRPKQAQVLKLRGINLSDDYADGCLIDSKNISTRRYPYFATRYKRKKLEGYHNVKALTSWNKLIALEGTELKYDGRTIATLTEGEKQFAVINTKMVIMPDKKYLDFTDLSLHDMEIGTSISGTTTFVEAVFDKQEPKNNKNSYIEITDASVDFTQIFSINDGVTISGCVNNPNNNVTCTISNVEPKKLSFVSHEKNSMFKNIIETGTETATLTIERKVPNMDYICSSDNRIFGCCNETQTIHCCALGDPTNFYDFSGESTDSYAVAVGSEGNFTGCVRLGSSVLFYKENVLHKLLGDYPANYSIYTYNIEGVKAGCHKSMQVMNETLIYLSSHGVFTYSGGSTNYISSQLGDKRLIDAVAGTDGEKYYLSCLDDGKRRFFVFDIKNNIWMLEDDTRVRDFARFENELYFADENGDVYTTDSREIDKEMEWMMHFTPFIEGTDTRSSSSSYFNKKTYTRIVLRVQMPKESIATISIRYDGGRWEEMMNLVGEKDGTTPIVLTANRCDKFEIKIEGKGEFALLNMTRLFNLESDR